MSEGIDMIQTPCGEECSKPTLQGLSRAGADAGTARAR